MPGVLCWEPDDGATLELIGGFSPGPEFRENPAGGWVATEIVGDVRPGTIYGESAAGELISIWDAQRGSHTVGFGGGVREEFWPSSWICVGAHIISPQEPALVKATVTIDEIYYLTDDGRFCAPQWAKIEGVEHPGSAIYLARLRKRERLTHAGKSILKLAKLFATFVERLEDEFGAWQYPPVSAGVFGSEVRGTMTRDSDAVCFWLVRLGRLTLFGAQEPKRWCKRSLRMCLAG
ncbi:ApeA N-terminal domain 1-containing protein [Mycolicibacterium sarraceniae]|uniref:ApeA N-terminal domain 1-containing protein n=1 Tax=Mycolicibacterium sarraceniae TaxID=1534348 RepID=UPI0013D8662F|nr:hypothetical protein [Mycolicibacterium sarraceniae]